MAFEIILTREANIEFERACCYYDILDLKEEFLDDFLKQLKILGEHPFSFQIRYGDARILRFDDFRYTIHYTIKDSLVLIYNILGDHQNY